MKQSFALLAHRPSLADGLEVGAWVEKGGQYHASGGSGAGVDVEEGHGGKVLLGR